MDRRQAGRLRARGTDAVSWLQGMVSNDIYALTPEHPRIQAFVLNATGHIETDLVVVKEPNGDLLLDLPGSETDRIYSLLDRYIVSEDVDLEDASAATSALSVQGPLAESTWRAAQAALAGDSPAAAVTVVPADHTGSGGLDLYMPAARFEAVWKALISSGAVVTLNEDAELLRIEAGIPKLGAEIDSSVLALEADPALRMVSLTKGCYVGQEIVARIHSRGHTNRSLAGFLVIAGSAPEPGEQIALRDDAQRREIGRVTSSAFSSPAARGAAIALGYLRHEACAAGAHLTTIRNAELQVVDLPFYKKDTRE